MRHGNKTGPLSKKNSALSAQSVNFSFYIGKYNISSSATDGNASWFNSEKFSAKIGDIIQVDNSSGYTIEIAAFNTSDTVATRTVVSTFPYTITADGSYVMQGYTQPIVSITDAILKQVSNNAVFKIIRYADVKNPTKESAIGRSKPILTGDTKDVVSTTINPYKYPFLPVWGHEYLEHWYEKVYEATNPAVVVLDGDSTTANQVPQYGGVNDTFVDMRGYGVKKIMKAGGYPLANLTVVNNGHGGRSSCEWVGNATYGNPTYITSDPNGFLATSMAANPDLLIVAWGLNDADSTNTYFVGLNAKARLDLFELNMREGLRRIRGNVAVNGRPAYNKDVSALSIILCMPTIGGSPSTGRGNENWNQYVREVVQKLCREFNCAFADMTMRTYAYTTMGSSWSSRTSTGTFDIIHPNKWQTAQLTSMLQDLIYPVAAWNIAIP